MSRALPADGRARGSLFFGCALVAGQGDDLAGTDPISRRLLWFWLLAPPLSPQGGRSSLSSPGRLVLGSAELVAALARASWAYTTQSLALRPCLLFPSFALPRPAGAGQRQAHHTADTSFLDLHH